MDTLVQLVTTHEIVDAVLDRAVRIVTPHRTWKWTVQASRPGGALLHCAMGTPPPARLHTHYVRRAALDRRATSPRGRDGSQLRTSRTHSCTWHVSLACTRQALHAMSVIVEFPLLCRTRAVIWPCPGNGGLYACHESRRDAAITNGAPAFRTQMPAVCCHGSIFDVW